MKNFVAHLTYVVSIAGTILLLTFQASAEQNATLTVRVDDVQGQPLNGFAISAVPVGEAITPKSDGIDTMDQINRQFAPHFLMVQRGTKVRFPNSDSIKHHVYSFSPAKRFELLLNRGMEEDPLLFEKTGIVELGCNVHDWMLGYIYVVDTPFFGYTNAEGQVTLDLPPGEYDVSVWHPRMQEEPEVPVARISAGSRATHEFRMSRALLPSFEDYEEEDEFSEYD